MCRLKAVYQEIYRFERDLREATGLSVNESMILCTIYDSPSTSGELAAELTLSAGRMSRILDELEKKTYIMRAFGESDRRVITVTITARGRECIETVRGAALREPDFLKYLKAGEKK